MISIQLEANSSVICGFLNFDHGTQLREFSSFYDKSETMENFAGDDCFLLLHLSSFWFNNSKNHVSCKLNTKIL